MKHARSPSVGVEMQPPQSPGARSVSGTAGTERKSRTGSFSLLKMSSSLSRLGISSSRSQRSSENVSVSVTNED